MLLAQWARVDPRPFASITLNDSHNDPAVLLSALIDAARPIEPLPEAVVSTMQGSQLDLDLVVTRLEAALRARSVDSVLVLDELEHLSSKDSLRLLETIMAGVTGGSRLAMASRRAPPIHLMRLRAARRLIVIETEDLVMTRGEAGQLLAEGGLRASEAELETILTKTEGWPVALYLATLGRRPDPASALPEEGFGGQEHNLVEYIRDEFLSIAPPEDVEFLVRISLLDRLSGDLCDSVSGIPGSGSRLVALAHRNMLLIPLDSRDEWFRMHSLFAEMLGGELRRRHAEEVDELNRRASTWWESAGDPERAIRFAIDGSDFARAGRLIWEAVPAFNTTGRYASIQAWIERVGLPRAAHDPHLSLTVAHGALAAGDGAGAEYWAEVARPLVASGVAGAADLPAALAMIDATLARGGTVAMGATAAAALASLDGDTPWAAMADLMAGVAAHLRGDGGRARRRLSDAARRAAVWGIPLIQVLALAQLALLAAAEDDWQSARILASQARAQVERSGLLARPSIALAVAVSAYVNANDRRRAEALSDLDLARALLARLDDFGPWFEIETAAALAAAATLVNDPRSAAGLIAKARGRLAALADAPMLEAWVTEIEDGLATFSESGLAELTPAEMKVVRLLPSHLSYRQIAAELNVSPNTIKSQVRSAFGKLGVSSRHEAVEFCRSLDRRAGRDPAFDLAAADPTRPTTVGRPVAPSG
ncbi:MAG TPA: LuxR C-terminal-related transcriptional regulator [Solirubrobacterales bacterium]|nr:LuxR C-terminal-related transcriptional regulator [Solirubrobacterales bacterium]